MPFCPNCGRETVPGAVYCANCGKPLQAAAPPPFYSQPQYYQRKEPAIAAILSLLITGVGQMYVGRILRGIIILLAPLIAAIFIIPGIFFLGFLIPITETLPPGGPPVISPAAFFGSIILLILLSVGYWIWNIFDAYNLAKRYNQKLEATGRPPW